MSETMSDVSGKSRGIFGKLGARFEERVNSLRLVTHYLHDAENLLAENRILKWIGVASFLTALLMSIVVGFQAQRTRVVVAPFGGASPDLLIVGDRPSLDYLSAIGRNVVALTGTFTAATADYQFNEVLKFVHPSRYELMRDDWKKMVEGLRQYREVSFATYVLPQKPIEVYGNRMRIAAERARYIGDKVGSETGVVEIGYVVEEGRFWITSVDFLAPGAANVE
jgi:conjugal transfer pilus assembly protein TraE